MPPLIGSGRRLSIYSYGRLTLTRRKKMGTCAGTPTRDGTARQVGTRICTGQKSKFSKFYVLNLQFDLAISVFEILPNVTNLTHCEYSKPCSKVAGAGVGLGGGGGVGATSANSWTTLMRAQRRTSLNVKTPRLPTSPAYALQSKAQNCFAALTL